MPHILMGDHAKSGSITDIRSKDLGYEYPDDLNLRPGSPLHEFLKKEIMDRAQESRNEMEKRFDSWGEIDKSLTAYIKLSDAEKVIKNKDKTDQKPLSIVFPYSYSVLETVLTYLLMAFGQEPILRYEGVSPEDTIGAILLEKVIALQCNKSKVILNLHTMNRDGIAYGIGPVAPYWNERWGERTVKVPDDNVFGSGFRKEVQEMMLFEGNALMNIDPYLYLPDPNVPVDRIQDGAFVGWVDIDNYLGLLEEEYNSQDTFNVRYLEGLMSKYSIFAEKDSKRREFIGGHRLEHTDITKRVDKINMYINIIPKEWKLSTREYPQKWFFQLAADEVIIKAKPLGLDHNMYPIAVAAPEFDGYSVTPISRLEVLGGLQKVLNWMFNSHVANVRKAINDMLVVDPYLINIEDLKTPEPGKLIRMRRPAWGKGVKDAVMQLGVTDITANNIKDSALILQWMQEIGGADKSALSGSVRTGGPERLTGQEFQGARSGALSRMERIARVVGLQSMQDIGYMFASHTQQLMSQDTYIKSAGRWQEDLMKEYGPNAKKLRVSPFDILIDYDVMVRDGSIPGGNFSQAWVKMFELLGKHPLLSQRVDVYRVFLHIARNMGAKNAHEFENVQAQIMPNDQVNQQVQQGNMIPMGGMGGV
uniref:Portal protein n=1 Tax=viral metagenome TaxID=1070528 RepID=A0A6M3IZ38_9ZZZZ